MTERDKDIAKQAGLKTYQEQAPGLDGMVGSWEAIEAFAAFIRADEREVCLKLCKENFYAHQAYEDIRARGNT
jgi:hypothetical protein